MIFAKNDGDAYAVVGAECHGHGDQEAWLDITLGSWVEPYSDHFTASCRVSQAGAGAVDAPVASKGEASHYGELLTREAALMHPRISEVWDLVDAVVTGVPEVATVVYGDA